MDDSFNEKVGAIIEDKSGLLTVLSEGKKYKRSLAEGLCELTGNTVNINVKAANSSSSTKKEAKSEEALIAELTKAKEAFLGKTVSFITKNGEFVTGKVVTLVVAKSDAVLLKIKGTESKAFFKTFSENMDSIRVEEGFDQELFDAFAVESVLRVKPTLVEALTNLKAEYSATITEEQVASIDAIIAQIQNA